MLYFLIIVCLIQAFGGKTERLCGEFFPEEMEDDLAVDAQLLPVVCPKVDAYVECFEKEVSRRNLHLNSAHNSTKDLMKSICEEGNKLHEGYVKHFKCYQNLDQKWPECYERAQDAYLNYRKFITAYIENDENEEDDDEFDDEDSFTNNEPYCMMEAYGVACLSVDILKRCGRDAEETFLELVKRSEILRDHCKGEELEKLRTEFLDYLVSGGFSHPRTLNDVFHQ